MIKKNYEPRLWFPSQQLQIKAHIKKQKVALAEFKQLYFIQFLRDSHCTLTVCLLEPSYMDVCPPDDLQKPVGDLFSIDGSLLEQPPSKAALLWGVAPRQLGDLVDTNTVAQPF